MMARALIALTLLLNLSACSFNEGEGRNTVEGRIAEELREARAALRPITGTWAGTLQRGSQTLSVELSIQEDLVPTGRTSDGQTVFRVDPRATFSSLDGRYNQSLTGAFIKSTGELILSAPSANLRLDDIQVLNLLLRDGVLTGSARSPSGYIGEVVLTRQGQQSDENRRDNEEVQAERLRNVYAPLVGNWIGTVDAPAGPTRRFQITMRIYIDEEPTTSGRTMPVLKAFYDRLDLQNSGVARRTLFLTYSYSNNPPTLFATSQGSSAATNPNLYTVSISGRFIVDPDGRINRLEGTHTSVNQGISGTLDLRRVQ